MEPITNFTDNNYPNIQIKYSADDMMNIWSVLLSKMQEDYYKSGGTGLFPKLASFVDFNDDTDEEKGSFSYFLEDLIQNYKDNDWNSNPAEHWNDSWAAALKSFITGIYYLNHQDEIDYEDSAEIYINKEGDIVNPNNIRGGISSSGVSFRYKDVLKADAGANFVTIDQLYSPTEIAAGIDSDVDITFEFKRMDMVEKYLSKLDKADSLNDVIADLQAEFNKEYAIYEPMYRRNRRFFNPYNQGSQKYGNVDMDNRQKLVTSDGYVETVLGGYAGPFYIENRQQFLTFCYSCMVQQDSGIPRVLTNKEINDYLEKIVNEGINWDDDYNEHDELDFNKVQNDIYAYDAAHYGIISWPSIDGVNNRTESEIIEDLKTTIPAVLSEYLHFVGKYGSLQLLEQEIADAQNRQNILRSEAAAIKDQYFSDCSDVKTEYNRYKNGQSSYFKNTEKAKGIHLIYKHWSTYENLFDKLISDNYEAFLNDVKYYAKDDTWSYWTDRFNTIDDRYSIVVHCKTEPREFYSLIAPWVIPWYNINGDSYSTVRGIDKCIAALSSSENLDFTTENLHGDKNIRLIMPRNTRKVEVEDLNRNFWVIAQVISAMSIYLFDENGPIPKSFKDLIGALTDIWENVEYLWTSIAAIGQTPYITKVKTLVFPLTVEEIMPYNKFDNFENFSDSSIFDGAHDGDVRTLCEQRLGYLKDSYEDCHLAILPEIRLNNYEKNYYSKVFYPGIMVLNRNDTNSWSWLDFVDDNGDYLSHHFLINSASFSDLYVIKENEERYYDYFVPAGAPPTEDISRRFYKLLRPEYDINCYYDEENNAIAWDLEHKIINYYDLARYIIEDELVCVWTNGVWSAQTLEGGAGEIDITQGFYQGELLSAPVNSNALQWDIGGTVYELQADSRSFSEVMADQQNIKDDSINVLNKILEIRTGEGDADIGLPKINDNVFHLFIGNHLYEADPQSSASENHHEHNYYKVVNNSVVRDTDYVRVANGISCGGVLWNPISNQIESYPDYWTYSNYQAYGPFLLSSLKIEIYLKKDSLKVEEDNWLIKVSEVIGSTVGSAQLPEEYVYDYDYMDVNKAINERIFVSYFMPNSKFAMKKKERTPLAADNPGAFPTSWTITGSIPNMDDYKLLNTTRRGGVWQRRNKGVYANYELYPNKGF